MNIFSKLILFSAIAIASVAAFFSVTGIGQLFSASMIPVMVMAAALELGKLVSVSFLYQYWTKITKLLKSYMIIGTVVLMVITSAGIYGYLSNAYARIAVNPQMTMNEMSLSQSRVENIDSTISRSKSRASVLESRITQRENRTDSLYSKNSITSARAQERSTKTAESDLRALNKQIEGMQLIRDSLSLQNLNLKNSVVSNKEIGAYIYIASALGVSLDTVVKWFILIIVMVFDPMSISLFLAFNTAISKKDSKERKEEISHKSKNIPEYTTFIDEIPIVDAVEEVSNVVELDSIPKPISEPASEPEPEPEPEHELEVGIDPTMPYYRKPGYDWGKDEWKGDSAAVEWKRHNV